MFFPSDDFNKTLNHFLKKEEIANEEDKTH